jgi:hypothetical protein
MITLTTNEDGTVTYEWPEGLVSAPISEELFALLVKAHNQNIKLTRDSIRLNSAGWKIAEALGKVGPDDDEIETDLEEDLDELIRRAQ